tara:strand:- start:298 stop:540 length:243 start_codon:yes stop_codon:yes gene_type:complete
VNEVRNAVLLTGAIEVPSANLILLDSYIAVDFDPKTDQRNEASTTAGAEANNDDAAQLPLRVAVSIFQESPVALKRSRLS